MLRTILLEAIAQNLKTIATGVTAGDPRVMGRVLRSFAQLRRTMEPEVLKALLEERSEAFHTVKTVKQEVIDLRNVSSMF